MAEEKRKHWGEKVANLKSRLPATCWGTIGCLLSRRRKKKKGTQRGTVGAGIIFIVERGKIKKKGLVCRGCHNKQDSGKRHLEKTVDQEEGGKYLFRDATQKGTKNSLNYNVGRKKEKRGRMRGRIPLIFPWKQMSFFLPAAIKPKPGGGRQRSSLLFSGVWEVQEKRGSKRSW